jgi:hypothetical protein
MEADETSSPNGRTSKVGRKSRLEPLIHNWAKMRQKHA